MSKRVRFLKEEEGGRKAMCEAKARDTARNLSQMGMSLEKIAQAAE